MRIKNKIFKIGLVTILVAMVTISCKKSFLDEELKTSRDLEFYKTDAGIQQLVIGTYHQVFATPFNGEMAFSNMSYGADEFRVGGDPSNGMYNSYGNTFGPIVTPNNANTVFASARIDSTGSGSRDEHRIFRVQDVKRCPEVSGQPCREGERHAGGVGEVDRGQDDAGWKHVSRSYSGRGPFED